MHCITNGFYYSLLGCGCYVRHNVSTSMPMLFLRRTVVHGHFGAYSSMEDLNTIRETNETTFLERP